MPNALTALGLQLATREEWIDFFTQAWEKIYGSDVNLESDTPDGQMMNIMVQVILDLQDLVASVYNGFDPDSAVGNVLSQRVTINGIQRQAGTYTITPITIVVSQSVNLYGLDQEDQDVYTIEDNEGNRWELMETQLGVNAGTHVFDFRAAVPGEQLTIPNTITVPVTVVIGVVSVNNPTSYTTLGINEETDAQLRLRRQRSVSLASQGYLPGLLAALENINGVTSAFVYENTTDITDGDGIPGHSIWVIVAGTGSDEEIAQAIYTKRNAGCGMFGSQSYTVTQVDGSPFIVNWDNVLTKNLFIKFDVSSIDGVLQPNIQAIRDGLSEDFIPGVNETVNINSLATMVQAIDSNTLVTNAGFSTCDEQTISFSGVPASGDFTLTYNGNGSAPINWNDSAGTIQSTIQALPGLANTTVSGSLAGQALDFDLSGEDNVMGIIQVTDNTLETSAPAPITPSYTQTYANTLAPLSKQNQFVVSWDNIIITPIQLTPMTGQVATVTERQFTAFGGYGVYIFDISVNNSGGSIDPDTGLYESGITDGVTDTIRVTDALGNTATATVQVV